MIRKKKESSKEFLNLTLVILDQVFIKQSFAIMIPTVPICARHRLVLIGIFLVSSFECFTFILRKSHENPPNKLIVTKFIRDTLPMFNNKVFLDFIDKISSRIDNKNKKDKKQRAANPHKYL